MATPVATSSTKKKAYTEVILLLLFMPSTMAPTFSAILFITGVLLTERSLSNAANQTKKLSTVLLVSSPTHGHTREVDR